jgi:DNA mismatch repair ATPase MutL
MDGEIGVRTKAIIVALLVCLSAPQLGCASVAKQGSVPTERAATAVKNKDKKKPSEEKATQTSGAKTEEKKESDGKDQKSDDSKKEDNKSSDSSKSNNKGDSSQSKQNSGSNNSSSNGGSQKKWVAEQGHWETDYGQVWVSNWVYTTHPRYWVNHGGTMVGPFDSSDAAYAWIINDGENGGIGGSVVNDSYETKEDQGHYEQKATGQHWVVDVAGHWE